MGSTRAGTACPSCGQPAAGRFCRNCGAAVAGAACAACSAALVPGARFCSGCGAPVGGAARPAAAMPGTASAPRAVWIGAAAAVLVILGLVAWLGARERPAAAAAPATAAGAAGAPLPDLSTLTPRERFDRLYNRVMQAAEGGDEGTMTTFMPMALAAYSMLDTVDSDARYHAGLLRLHVGQMAEAEALADTILVNTPGHLLGYALRATAARWKKDDAELRAAYAGFLEHWDAENGSGREEYTAHRTTLDDVRRQALAAAGGAAPVSPAGTR